MLLKPWTLISGSRFNDGNRLTDAEVDGYITLTETTTLSVTNVPFHFVPIKTADVTLGNLVDGSATATVSLTNTSPYTGSVEVYPLFDVSPQFPVSPKLTDAQPVDLQYVGANIVARSGQTNTVAFAIGTYEDRSHPINIGHDIYIDVDQDGVDDYVVFNTDLGTERSTGIRLGELGNGFCDSAVLLRCTHAVRQHGDSCQIPG